MAPNTLNQDSLSHLLESLVIPLGFKEYDDALPYERAVLDDWARRSTASLEQLKRVLEAVDTKESLLQDMAQAVVAVSPFAYRPSSLNEEKAECPVYEEERNVLKGESPWITPGSETLAKDILSKVKVERKAALVKQVLEHTVKPIFRASNPHPHIDPATGRSLPPSRIARLPQQGGLSSLTQDFFDGEGQRWKESVGLGAVIYWCIDSISPDVYHDAWHLAVPPLMTLLDDYQARYKLWGLLIAGRMLRSVPPSLLHKTGIDGLLKTSFRKILAHQDTPLSPTILRLSLSQSVRLFTLTTPEGSKARFDALSDLLGQGIVNDIWSYTFDKPELVRATLNALPALIRSLGVGCTRFLQGLMPQLIHPLVNHPANQAQLPLDVLRLQMQIASLTALIPLIQVCAPRMHGWRFTILDAVVRCWTTMVADRSNNPSSLSSPWVLSPPEVDSDDEEGETDPPTINAKVILPDSQSILPSNPSSLADNSSSLSKLLQAATYVLAQACPSLTTAEYPLLLNKEPTVLKGLFPRPPSLEPGA